ncbi:MAG: hypothetical protein ABI881_13150 [Betaproteobacteria bacterium]
MRRPLQSGRYLLLLLAVLAVPASATLITFDFDAMAYRSSSTPGSNSAVQTYLNNTWSGAGLSGSVAVTGAGELSNNQYTGDGHVVGPSTCTARTSNGSCRTWTTTSATLGSTEGGVQGSAAIEAFSSSNRDNYIVNSGSDRIVITFPDPVYSISFDYEIFPDGSCPSSSQCGLNSVNLPDFEFLVGNSTASMTSGFATTYGAYPGTPGTYSHSPDSGHGSTEKAPQALRVSGSILFNQGVTTLAFVDWPERIGIDNLRIDTQCHGIDCPRHDAPEPPMLPIVALGLGLVWLSTRERFQRR